MGLPSVPLPRDEVEVAGEKVLIRGLSRSEAMSLAKFKDDADAAEDYVIACGVGMKTDEVRAWRDNTPIGVVDDLVNSILALSGLIEGAQKSD